MSRICITGGPRTGKTTLAGKLSEELGCAARHTDDLVEQFKHLGKDAWSAGSAEVAKWLDEPGSWVIEGVSVSRALRKWRDQHPGERPPVDRVIFLSEPYVDLSKGQMAMTKGVATIHDEIEGWLAEHGVATERIRREVTP